MRIAGVAGERCTVRLCFIQISHLDLFDKIYGFGLLGRDYRSQSQLGKFVATLSLLESMALAGIDIVIACDVRYCTEDSFFSVKEVNLAVITDLRMLQRLPAIVGFGNAMELALTSRKLLGPEASRKEG
ncbi:delta(3,5)-Delta(2,4)-dienoyl-CoA isomerase, mitochondrial-like [Macadamia integrifolia]|uniref:delta(3,5)-Delta(2,4)-dienoyl-CoA isomerase, mitochondrial-like n=1 Tax=Macadamia integrifolia TaxID=60698 RepID=UPI001C4F456F|nr:delta(3,5)-Delta(2,4)-dienoyl-CoA isomerase, mitochondrial-like [Macadamia integrifolia]